MLTSALFHLSQLRKNQWLSPSNLEALQFKKLRRLVRHAYENVLYYRRLFDSAGVKPEEIKTVEDLSRIPITTRKQLQELPLEERLANGVHPSKCKTLLTSGSSGIPLKVFLTEPEIDLYDMVWVRAFLENGQKVWDKIASLKYMSRPKRWYQTLGLWRNQILSLLEGPNQWIEVLQRERPTILRGNSFEIHRIAQLIREKGIEGIRPRVVFNTGSLLDPASRTLIDSTFHTKLFDIYGMTEVGCIAWECKAHQGWHINSDSVVLEFVDGERKVLPGERGRMICTGLHSFTMPFIRYDTGDLGVPGRERCPCGRSLPLLLSIEGRADDFFVTLDGRTHSPSTIVNQVKWIVGIGQYRLVQESVTDIVVWLIPNREYSEQTESEFKRVLKGIMGDRVNVEVKKVDHLPPDSGRKIRQLVSHVKAGKGF